MHCNVMFLGRRSNSEINPPSVARPATGKHKFLHLIEIYVSLLVL